MAALLDALISDLPLFAGAQAGFVDSGDPLFTFALSVVLIAAGVGVLALLPWTDQQIEATHREAEQAGRDLLRVVSRRVPLLPATVPHTR